MLRTQQAGDNKTHYIPLKWLNEPFAPGSAWKLICTAKTDPSDSDADAIFQKTETAGITVDGHEAAVSVVHDDTKDLFFGQELVCDIQAQNLTTGEIRTVAYFTLRVTNDITRDTDTSIPIYTTNPPAPSRGKSAYEVAVDNGFVGTEEEWLASLEGPTGPQGDTGATGPAGPAGPNSVTSDTTSDGTATLSVASISVGSSIDLTGAVITWPLNGDDQVEIPNINTPLLVTDQIASRSVGGSGTLLIGGVSSLVADTGGASVEGNYNFVDLLTFQNGASLIAEAGSYVGVAGTFVYTGDDNGIQIITSALTTDYSPVNRYTGDARYLKSADLTNTLLNSVLQDDQAASLTALGIGDDVDRTFKGFQNVLVSGTNIKTVEGSSLLGSGNLSLSGIYAPLSHTQTWSTITGTPTTLSGYGITDGITAATAASTYTPVTQKKTTNFTAVAGVAYIVNGTVTATLPASGTDGDFVDFYVHGSSSTVTINSIAYGTTARPIRFTYNGSSWSVGPAVFWQNVTTQGAFYAPSRIGVSPNSGEAMVLEQNDARYAKLSGGNTIAGAQTLSGQVELTGQAATNGTSAMTRGLSDARYQQTTKLVTSGTQQTVSGLTPTASTQLTQSLTAGLYEVVAYLRVAIDNTSYGLRVSSGFSGGLSSAVGSTNFGSVAATTPGEVAATASSASPITTAPTTNYLNITTGSAVIVVRYTFRVTSTGTWAIYFSSNNASGTATLLNDSSATIRYLA